jgi:hypothetical protein
VQNAQVSSFQSLIERARALAKPWFQPICTQHHCLARIERDARFKADSGWRKKSILASPETNARAGMAMLRVRIDSVTFP